MWELASIVVFLVVSQGFMVFFLVKSKKDPEIIDLTSNFQKLGEQIEEVGRIDTAQIPVDDERLAQIERRMESVESDVLKNLNKITQRERRLRDMQGLDDEPEIEVTPEQIAQGQAAVNGYIGPSDNSIDPMDYVLGHMTARR